MVVRSVGICLKPNQPQLAGAVRALEAWLGRARARRWCSARTQPPQPAARARALGPRREGRPDRRARWRRHPARRGPGRGQPAGADPGGEPGHPGLPGGDLPGRALRRPSTTCSPVAASSRSACASTWPSSAVARSLGHYLALNDAVIARTAMSRMVDLRDPRRRCGGHDLPRRRPDRVDADRLHGLLALGRWPAGAARRRGDPAHADLPPHPHPASAGARPRQQSRARRAQHPGRRRAAHRRRAGRLRAGRGRPR